MTRLSSAPAIALVASLGMAHAEMAPPPDDSIRGALDGLVFTGTMDVDQYDTPFPDRLTFANGKFYSLECQQACDFGWSPYHTRIEGGAVAFVADTACSDSPQFVNWRGRVTGDRIEGTVVWRVERFYWTVTRTATFQGTLSAEPETRAALTPAPIAE